MVHVFAISKRKNEQYIAMVSLKTNNIKRLRFLLHNHEPVMFNRNFNLEL